MIVFAIVHCLFGSMSKYVKYPDIFLFCLMESNIDCNTNTIHLWQLEQLLISKAVKHLTKNEPCPFMRNRSAENADVGHCRQRREKEGGREGRRIREGVREGRKGE